MRLALGAKGATLTRAVVCCSVHLSASRDNPDCLVAERDITVNPSWYGGDTNRLDALLRARYDTSIVPGSWFEMPERFRVGLGGPTEIQEEGLARIGSALDELK